MQAIGFHAVHGFDHRVRVVVDSPANSYGQRLVAYRDGCRYTSGYMFVPSDLMPIPAADYANDTDDWENQAEAQAVAVWVRVMPTPASDSPHAIDE